MALTEAEVKTYYQAILLREPTDAQLAVAMATGTADSLISALIGSSEAQDFVFPVLQVYQAVFGRVPDAAGLDFWVDAYRDGTSLESITAGFVASDEFVAQYGDVTDGSDPAFIQQLYINVLGRPGDADGLAFWTSQTGISPADVVRLFATDVEFTNKANGPITDFLTEAALGTQDYEGSLWDYVDHDGQTFTLTEGADLGAQPGQPFYGTDGDDVYVAGTVNSGGVNGNTLGSGDVLDGAGGDDTLSIIHDGATPLVAQISNIETVSIQALGNTDIDMRNAFGVETVQSNRSGAAVTFDNVVNNVLISLNESTGDVNVNFAGPVITDGSVNVELIGSQHVQTGGHVNVDVGRSEVTTLNVDSTGVTNEDWENWLEVTVGNNDADLETLNVTGDSAIFIQDMNSDFTDLTSVNVTNSGDTWIDLENNEADLSIVSGAGNDTFQLNADEVNSDDSFDGGDGDDNLWLHFNDSVDLLPSTGPGDPISPVIGGVNNATNFEALTIDIGNAYVSFMGTDISLDASLFDTVDNFNFNNWAADDLSGAILVENVSNDNSFSAWADINAGATFNAATGATTLNLELEGDANAITTDGFETVNLVLDNPLSNTDIGLLDMSPDTAAIVTGAAETFYVDLGDADGLTLNASGLTTEGEIEIDRSGATTTYNAGDANFITGGGGSDTLIGTAQDDVLDGGSVFVPAANGVTTVNLNNLTDLDADGDSTDDALVSVTMDVDGVSYTGTGGSATSAALSLSGALIDAGLDASASGGIVTITSTTPTAAVVTNVEANVDPAVADIAGPTGAHTPGNAAVAAVAAVQTLTFSDAAGAYGIGDVISYDFDDGAGSGAVTVSYTVTATDVATGDPAQIAANVAAGFIVEYNTVAATGPGALLLNATVSRTGNVVEVASNNAGANGAGQNIVGVETSDTSNAVTPAIDTAGANAILATPETFAINDYLAADAGVYTFTVDGVSASFDVAAGTNITGIEIADALEAIGGAIQSDGAGNNSIGFTSDDGTPPVITATFDAAPSTLAQDENGLDGDPATTADNIVTSVDGAGQWVYTSDTFTGGEGSDIFVVQTADISTMSSADAAAAADVITDFLDGEDLLNFGLGGVAGSSTNYAEGPVGGHGNFNGALAQATSDLAASWDGATFVLDYSAQQVGEDVFIFADLNDDGALDQVVQLTGVTLADLSNDGSFIVA